VVRLALKVGNRVIAQGAKAGALPMFYAATLSDELTGVSFPLG
jgi:hypothetical protein